MKKKTKRIVQVGAMGLTLAIGGIVPTLIGRDPAPGGKDPSPLRIFSRGGTGTATLIWPPCLLSTAHCMGGGATVEFV